MFRLPGFGATDEFIKRIAMRFGQCRDFLDHTLAFACFATLHFVVQQVDQVAEFGFGKLRNVHAHAFQSNDYAAAIIASAGASDISATAASGSLPGSMVSISTRA